MRKKYLFFMLLIVSIHSFASMGGLPFESTLESVLSIFMRMGRYVIGAGVLVFVMMYNMGSRESAQKIGGSIVFSGLVVANLEFILDFLGLTGGATF